MPSTHVLSQGSENRSVRCDLQAEELSGTAHQKRCSYSQELCSSNLCIYPPKNTSQIWRHGSGAVPKWFDITVCKIIQMHSVSKPVWLYVHCSWRYNDSEGLFMDFWLRSNTNKSLQNFNIRSHPKRLFSLSAESLQSSRNPLSHIYSRSTVWNSPTNVTVAFQWRLETLRYLPRVQGFVQCELT